MKKLIIWDFDGPIIDSRELALELTQYQFHDITEDVHRDLFNGNIFEEISKLNKKDFKEEDFLEFVEKSYTPRKIGLIPVDGIKDVLSELSVDFDMVINSSANKNTIKNFLTKNELNNCFKEIYGNEIKSKEEKFRVILKDFNTVCDDCILITDTVGDVMEASMVDIRSIVILWGYQLRKHFDLIKQKVIFVEEVDQLTKTIRENI